LLWFTTARYPSSRSKSGRRTPFIQLTDGYAIDILHCSSSHWEPWWFFSD
jgi:hypothetical protein